MALNTIIESRDDQIIKKVHFLKNFILKTFLQAAFINLDNVGYAALKCIWINYTTWYDADIGRKGYLWKVIEFWIKKNW